MMRCPQCGCRLASADPVCPAHGVQALAEEAARLPAPPPDPRIDGFVIQKRIGQGGFGAVYRAERQSDAQPVAIKVALGDNPAARRSLDKEIWALQLLRPPYTPALMGKGTTAEGNPFLALEYVPAPTLAEVMDEMPGLWTFDRLAVFGKPLLSAMAEVHRAGIVHRDIKPENFFVSGQGTNVTVRVFDFGLAAPTGQPGDPESAREGTPEYMAPEQDAAELSIDPRADVYALGVMFYELLAGALPFPGTAADMREGHRSRRPPLLARRLGLSQPLEAVILRCLAKDRERRFADAGALLAELKPLFRAAAPDLATTTMELPAITSTSGSGRMPAAPPEPGAPAKAKAEQRPLALLFFKPNEGQAVGPGEARRLGGELASASPSLGLVLAFDHESSDNPVRLAASAAQRVVELGMTDRALVDSFSVLVQIRPNGQRRFVSANFNRKDKYPGPSLPAGVLLTQAALELVPQLDAHPVPEHADLHLLDTADKQELTVVGAVRHAFVGRDTELETLFASARAAASPTPTIATVVAEGGLGKSELAGALASGLPTKVPAGNLFAFRCQEGLDGGGSRSLGELLRFALALPKEAPEDRGRALLAEHLAHAGEGLWAPAALAVGWVGLELPELQETLAAPGALRAAQARAVGEALRLSAKTRPVLVIADDAHLADETLLDALEYATLKEGGAAVWVCVLTRPSLLVGRPLLGARAAENPRLDLTPLRTEDALSLARLLLQPAENVPTPALQKLVARTQGNPLLLVELVRGLKRDGAIQQSSKGEYKLAAEAIDQLPDSPVMQWLATREIESLPPDLAGHARMAALLGSEVSDTELEGVIALGEGDEIELETLLDAGVGLRRLVDAGVLVRHRNARYSFRYGVLRDATYNMVPEARRREIHALAFRFYEAQVEMPEEEALPRRAFHSARAGLREEAAHLFIRLAERARRRHAYLEASNLYSQAREQIDTVHPERIMPLSLAHGLMQFRLGNYDRAFERLSEARSFAQQLQDRRSEFEILVEMSTVLDFLHHYEESKRVVDEAAQLMPEDNDPLSHARVQFGRGRSLYRFSRVEESIPPTWEAARVAETLGDAGYETRVDALQMVGAALGTVGRLDEALAVFDELLEICAQHGDVLHETATLGNRVYVWLPRGNFAQLRLEYERALNLARENCFSTVETNLIHNLAEVALITGDLESADSYAARVVALSDRTSGQSPYPALVMLLLRARASIAKGDEAAATAFLQEIARRQDTARQAGHPIELMPSDAVLRDTVELATRDATADEWKALFARCQEFSVQLEPIEIHALRGLAAQRRGQTSVAREALAHALTLAQGTPWVPPIEAWLAALAA
ncbi:MAG: protein kinase [Myxococcales bacterium]|nr:protein kinase [Myxococcales bacterium]